MYFGIINITDILIGSNTAFLRMYAMLQMVWNPIACIISSDKGCRQLNTSVLQFASFEELSTIIFFSTEKKTHETTSGKTRVVCLHLSGQNVFYYNVKSCCLLYPISMCALFVMPITLHTDWSATCHIYDACCSISRIFLLASTQLSLRLSASRG